MPRHPDRHLPPRTRLPDLVARRVPVQSDARCLLGVLDPPIQRPLVGHSRHDAGLLVAEPSGPQGLPEPRHPPEPPLQPGPLLDRARREPQPLGAIVLEAREPQVAPQPLRPDRLRQLSDQVVPGPSHRGQLPQPRVDDPRRALVADLRRRDRFDVVQVGPATGLPLQRFLQRVRRRIPGRWLVPPRAPVRAQELLAHDLEPLPARGRGSEQAAGQLHGLLDPGHRLRRGRSDHPLPRLRLRPSPRARRQFTDRETPGPLDPLRLVAPERDSQDHLRLPGRHLPASDRRSQHRPRPQLPGEPAHGLGRAPRDAQDLAPVIGELRVAEPEQPLAVLELREPLPHRDVDRSAPPGHAREQPVDQPGRLAPRQPARPVDALGPGRELLEHHRK